MSTDTPIFRSPITPPSPVDQAASLQLADLTGVTTVLLVGKMDETVAKAVGGDLPARPGDLVHFDGRIIARLTPNELYLFETASVQNKTHILSLAETLSQANSQARITDYTHGKAVLKLRGSAAAELLSKICGLNFQAVAFPNQQVKQTSVAKVKTLIARQDEADLPTYYLHVDRPLGQYFWDVVWDAGQEFGIG